MSRIFLLSPANLSGLRAKQLTSPRAKFEAALKYQSGGVEIAEAMAFMSALYFRGKIAYARQFARPSPNLAGDGIFVIAPGFGLVPQDWAITHERMKKLRVTPVDAAKRSYTRPLREHAGDIAKAIGDETEAEVVLLGSVASGKYVDILWPLLGEKLRFPAAFAGLGDMARGGLMLRSARANRELEYTTLDAPRHRAPGTSGKMPRLL